MSNLKDPRVLFAAERTLLAWNRTSLAFIAFGFVIERSGLLVKILAPAETSNGRLMAIFAVGCAFILLGVGCAVFSALQYRKVVLSAQPEEIPPGYSPLWGTAIHWLVALLGVILAGVLIQAHL
ncbi:YidH family protein [Halioxenophilus aromaticivorans]|uniref:DUF202 domain-containing protein n=1 Tax=Halioxenophilus aromaticivorans TaxID=1306992 RepID=A0AAV3U488_9ALTE